MEQTKTIKASEKKIASVLADYRLACESREASMLGRKEVFMGKAKFGIFGDGKELAQIAMAKVFRNGDHRSGYYRDQTFMFAIGELTLSQYFAQLYAHTDVEADPASAGRQMNGHFATRMIDERGEFKKLSQLKNSSSDISPTAAQMPRLVGLAYASKLFRNNPALTALTDLSTNGNEIAFGTIGNASTSEGMFFEAINAAGVLQIPMLMSVWDDDYGISVPQEYQTTKGSISKVLEGFQRTDKEKGFEIFTVKGWDYEALCKTYEKAEKVCREEHVPVLVHVEEMTQPQGHSTSGSHERYKSKQRLAWEAEHDCIRKMREWILEDGYASSDEVEAIEKKAKSVARSVKESSWKAFNADMQKDQRILSEILLRASQEDKEIAAVKQTLDRTLNPMRYDAIKAAKKAARLLRSSQSQERKDIVAWIERTTKENFDRYSSHLYSESVWSALNVSAIAPEYSESSPLLDGREILRA
ncbi:MAG TPA: thiamine pyrophosphate-dependent dehydrogenase E1 component subunit alpha, partial [Cyclobacteriaceae bacterium]|nr:thiamine pyrophosphate-dependent dehydrogenase E1 component subunit alpha [Cyclobacteriaceae bacterium]